MTTPPAPSPTPDVDTLAIQRVRAGLARMSPERFAACWQKAITLVALSLAQRASAPLVSVTLRWHHDAYQHTLERLLRDLRVEAT
jgi:hypothetical protein